MTQIQLAPAATTAFPAARYGERANYVVVDPHGWRLHQSDWGASAVLTEVVAGPEHALRRIASRPRSDGDGWLADAQAGVLVDPARRTLLFFCAHREALPLDLRAALFAVLDSTWPGWTVEWAYGGLADLQSYVGLPADPPPFSAAAGSQCFQPQWFRAPWWSDAIGTLVTVRHAAGDVLIHPLDLVRAPIWAGPALVGRMPPGVRQLDTQTWPACGIHLDLGRRAVGLWTASTFPGWWSGELAAVWSGWDLRFWADRLDAQLRVCDGAVRTPPVRLPAGAVRLANLLRDAWAEPSDAPHVDWLRDLAPAVGPATVDGVTARARREGAAIPSDAERRAVFDAVHTVAADAATG